MKTLITIALTIAVFHYHEVQASIYYWNNGTGAGSRSYWNNGTGVGSRYYWNNGTEAGSKYYWNNGTGAESLRELKYVCYGLKVSKATVPDICMIYPELDEMNEL